LGKLGGGATQTQGIFLHGKFSYTPAGDCFNYRSL